MLDAPDFPISMRGLLAGARRKESALLDLARKLVMAESPSDDKAAVDACVNLAAAHARASGGRVQLHHQTSLAMCWKSGSGQDQKPGA